MPPKKHIIIIGVLCVIALASGYWVGLPKEGSGGGGGNGDPKEPEFLKQGLVAYYPFNGNAKDESGNGNDGEVNGATLTVGRHGQAEQAYNLDGVDDYLTFDISSSFPFGENAFGMAVWINIANTLPTWRTILATDTYNTKGGNGISLYQNGKELSFWVGGFNSAKNICHASDLFGTATWTHVIVTRNKGSVNLYVDGVRKAAGTVPRILDGNLLYLGKNISNFFYYGQIDDVRIYNRALSEAEVKELYEFEKPKTQQASTVKPPVVVVPTPVKPQPKPTFTSDPSNKDNVKIEAAIRKAASKPTGELIKVDLEKVTLLNLAGYQISDLSALKELKQLARLSLSNNKITDVSVLKELKQLTNLELQDNQISDLSPLKGLKQLRDLRLFNNKITDMNALKELTQLTYLNLHNNQISDVSALKELKQLARLSLSNNKITDVSVLKELKQLTNLELQDNQISDLSPLKELKQLRDLRLFNNPDLTKAQIDELKKALPKCEITSNATK